MSGKLLLAWEDGTGREVILNIFGNHVPIKDGEIKSLTIKQGEWVIEEETSFTPGDPRNDNLSDVQG